MGVDPISLAVEAAPAVLSTGASLFGNISQSDAERDVANINQKNQMAMLEKQLGATSSENALDRALKEKEFSGQLGENALERNLKEDLQREQLSSTSSESALDRALKQALQNQTIGSQEKMFNAENELNKQKFGLEQKQFDTGQSNYQNMLKNALGLQTAGENELNAATASELPELGQMRQDLKDQTNEQLARQLNESRNILAQSGVRGSQAATNLSRSQGELTNQAMRDINQLSYEDALARRNAKTNLAGQKALTGYSAGVKTA